MIYTLCPLPVGFRNGLGREIVWPIRDGVDQNMFMNVC